MSKFGDKVQTKGKKVNILGLNSQIMREKNQNFER